QAEDGIRDFHVTGVQTCALPIYARGVGCFRFCYCCSELAVWSSELCWVVRGFPSCGGRQRSCQRHPLPPLRRPRRHNLSSSCPPSIWTPLMHGWKKPPPMPFTV